MTRPTACVAGWPIEHSRSPVLHRFWLEEHGIDGDYIRIAVRPGAFDAFLADIAAGRYVGANITVPHKEAAFAGIAVRDAAATATGAVNTIWRENGELAGTNTDPAGLIGNLDEDAPGWDAIAGRAVVLGAGGAARGIAWALAERGRRVVVANRTFARAERLAADIGEAVSAIRWDEIGDALPDASLLVNATTLGMVGKGPSPHLPLERLPAGAVVNDIVYLPLETGLLAAASRRGLRTVDGLGMLLHQAVPGFARWFAIRPRVSPALRSAVLADLGQN